MLPMGISGIGTSSSSSSSEESDVRLSSPSSSSPSSDSSSSSLSLEDSVHVEGSYSCLSGDDERRLFLNAGRVGVNTGVVEPFKVTGVAGLGERCGGGGGGSSPAASIFSVSSLLDLRCFLLAFAGAEEGYSLGPTNTSVSLVGVVG